MNRATVLSPLDGVRHWARNDPARVAVVDGQERYSYGELLTRVEAAAHFFADRGAVSGGVIGMSLRNSTDAMVIPLAAAALGAQISPVNFRLKARELRAIVDNLDATVFVYGDDLSGAVTDCYLGERQGFISVESFRAALSKPSGVRTFPGFHRSQQPYTLMWTSGTRGIPKPCRGSLAARMNWILTLPQVYGVREGDRYVAALPIVHSAGMTFALAHLFFGACVYPLPHFNVSDVWRLIHEEDITSGMFVPTMLQMLIEDDPHPERPAPATLRMLVTAGSRIRPKLHQQILGRFPGRLFTYYGSTESPSMTVLRPSEQEAHPDSVGKPYFGVEVEVRSMRTVPDYEMPVGDIFARNPFAMDEYGVEGVAVPISPEGWVETGDIGYFDAEGFLHVFGRASDVIISGGMNVSLPEIERVIALHPLVRDLAVVGIEDDRWGEVPAAIVVPADGCSAADVVTAVEAHCRAQLADFKRPRTILAVENVPRTAAGKAAAGDIKSAIAASRASTEARLSR